MVVEVSAKMDFIEEEGEESLAEFVFDSICPDNEPMIGLKSEKTKGSFTLVFSAEKVGTVLSTADDILMNVEAAIKIHEIQKKEN